MQPNSAISHLQCKPFPAAEQQYFAAAHCPAEQKGSNSAQPGGGHLQVHTPHLLFFLCSQAGLENGRALTHGPNVYLALEFLQMAQGLLLR